MLGTILWPAAEIIGGLPVTESQDQAVAGGGFFESDINEIPYRLPLQCDK